MIFPDTVMLVSFEMTRCYLLEDEHFVHIREQTPHRMFAEFRLEAQANRRQRPSVDSLRLVIFPFRHGVFPLF